MTREWSQEYTEYITKLIRNEAEFTLQELVEETKFSIATVRKYVQMVASSEGVKLRGIFSTKKDTIISVDKKGDILRDIRQRSEASEISYSYPTLGRSKVKDYQKYMCECKFENQGDLDTINLSVVAFDRHDAQDRIKEMYPGILIVSKVKTMEEHDQSKNRLFGGSLNISAGGSKLSSNSISHKVGKSKSK